MRTSLFCIMLGRIIMRIIQVTIRNYYTQLATFKSTNITHNFVHPVTKPDHQQKGEPHRSFHGHKSEKNWERTPTFRHSQRIRAHAHITMTSSFRLRYAYGANICWRFLACVHKHTHSAHTFPYGGGVCLSGFARVRIRVYLRFCDTWLRKDTHTQTVTQTHKHTHTLTQIHPPPPKPSLLLRTDGKAENVRWHATVPCGDVPFVCTII